MARPRIFVSSTYYDLKHLRSSIDNFIASLGFDSVLSEKGDIAYSPDAPLDESCYREIASVDVFVIVIGGRYGSEASGGDKRPSKDFFDRYDSITKKEYEAALARNIPIYILIDASVYAEYHTFLRNKDNSAIRYAHVDSVNVFHLIAEILSKPKNNPIQTFVRFGDIENWLRDQWAGLFRELLSRMSSQQQIETLSSQVDQLKEVNLTMRRYLEAMMAKVVPTEAPKLIASEHERLAEAQILDKLQANGWVRFVTRLTDRSPAEVRDALAAAKTPEEFCQLVARESRRSDHRLDILHTLNRSRTAQHDYNACRQMLGLVPLDFTGSEHSDELRVVEPISETKPTKAPTKRRPSRKKPKE